MRNSTKTILSMIDDLQHYNRDKSMLLKSYVEKRLSKSVNTYYE